MLRTYCMVFSASVVLLAACTLTSAQEDPEATPSQEELVVARRLIRETPSPGAPHNPLRVVRSVNYLHSLGKKQAVVLLFEVASPKRPLSIITDADGNAVDKEHRKHYRHDQTVCMIVPLLFDIPEQGVTPPDTWYRKRTRKWRGAAGTQVIQGDIPFAITGEWTYGGVPAGTRPLVDWAAKHGKLRAKQLHPQDDPLQAAETLHGRICRGGVGEFESSHKNVDESARDEFVAELKKGFKEQVIRMLLPPSRVGTGSTWDQWSRELEHLKWNELQREIRNLHIHWDVEKQRYTPTNDEDDR